ncbi:methyl-accepting chemotaxis protein [Acetobacterium wieringae]|uniref:methyl-accepting chemotaxis protein n=1 Tax=Acetobacterium wieringae TaxID=52694 RepID=UPI0026EF29A9|nr:methyl-accepting chemotaxis protein [Acetobacterium wieringae]
MNSQTTEVKGGKKVSLLFKLVSLLGAILISGCLILGGVALMFSTRALTENTESHLEETAVASSKYVGATMAKQLGELTQVAETDTMSSMNWEAQKTYLAGKVDGLGYLDMAVITPDLLAHYVVSGETTQLSERAVYTEALNGTVGISDVAISKVTNTPVVLEVAPIKKNGQVVGILMGRRDGTALNDITDNLEVGETGFAFIITKDGVINAHADKHLVLNQRNAIKEAQEGGDLAELGKQLQSIDMTRYNLLRYTYQGEKRITEIVPIAGTNWLLGIGDYESTVYASVTNLRNMLIWITLLVALGGCLAIYLSTRKTVVNPIIKIKATAEKLALGDVDVTVAVNSSDEIADLAMVFNEMTANRKLQAAAARRLSEGDFGVVIEPLSEQDVLSYSLLAVIAEMHKLDTGITNLEQAILEGQLYYKENLDDYPGRFSDLIKGVESIGTAFKEPLKLAGKAIAKIGSGQIPDRVTSEYKGIFNDLKNNVNSCVDGLGALTEGNQVLARMSKNDTSQRIAGDYTGIFGEIAESVNTIQDSLVLMVKIVEAIANGDLTILPQLQASGKLSDNDQLVPGFIKLMENISRLLKEADSLATAAVAGDLDKRADAARFPGDYAKVINGFNDTLDALTEPMQEASKVLNELARGNLSTAMTGEYQGQNGQIKADMNNTISFLKEYVVEISETLEKVSQGDFNQDITADYRGDFVKIKVAINDITAHISEILTEIGNAANQVEAGSRQISDGGQALAQGTTEQASAIQQLSASIDEVAEETKKNAQNADQANQRTLEVRAAAETGNNQMGDMVKAMGAINEASHNISKIIKVIDDIAFQTNILALNAAVEAARAGQHGKGFAVVAEEVRSLAARSAEASRETTGLIEGSIDKVEAGTRIANDTADSLDGILTSVAQVTDLVSHIAMASNDQATSIAQITQGIEQVSQVVQTNSATAEESAAASEELSSQAELLKNMVAEFKLKNKTVGQISLGQTVSVNPQKITAPINHQLTEPRILLDEMDKY